MHAHRWLLQVLLCGIAVAASVDPASALPVFARRYETSCSTCHVVVPKLNAFGIAFRNNGYRIPANEVKFVKVPDLELGAPGWKELWPKSIWPGGIPGAPPLAMRVTSDASLQPSARVNLNFSFPSGVNLYFVGPLGDAVSMFGNLFFSGATNSISIDRAYVQFKLMHETPGQNWLTLKLGRIDTRVEPFSSTFRRSTAQQFNTSDFRTFVNGFAFRDHDAGLVQGTAGRPEDNNFKDYYGTVSYKFGGLGVVGSRQESETDLQLQGYKEYSLTVGAFGYSGLGQPAGTDVTGDRLRRTGVKADVWLRDLNVFGALVQGHDRFLGASPRAVSTRAAMVEADYLLLPWVMPVLRLEKTWYSDRDDVMLVVPAVNLLVRANVRVLAEGRFYRSPRPGPPPAVGNQGLFRLDFAF